MLHACTYSLHVLAAVPAEQDGTGAVTELLPAVADQPQPASSG